MRYLERLLVGALVVGLLASTTSQAVASFSTIDVLGASATVPFAINGRGQIVGTYRAGGTRHGFLLDRGTFTTIDVPGATSTNATGINAGGQIVGYSFGPDAIVHGFLLDQGTFTTIDVPGAVVTEAFGINDRGQIVGRYSDGGMGTSHGYILF